MKVSINNKSRTKINKKEIVDLIDFFSKYYKLKDQELSIAIVGDRVMRRLNNEYRKKDKTTDILSFAGEDDFLGELIIDYSQIKRQTFYFSQDTKKELLFIIVHGLLHLIGYDDNNEKNRIIMIDKGKNILTLFLNK